jgi:hypothetical protein
MVLISAYSAAPLAFPDRTQSIPIGTSRISWRHYSLATRTNQLQQDFAGGALNSQQTTYAIIAVATVGSAHSSRPLGFHRSRGTKRAGLRKNDNRKQ